MAAEERLAVDFTEEVEEPVPVALPLLLADTLPAAVSELMRVLLVVAVDVGVGT